jgi:hypothetical protein
MANSSAILTDAFAPDQRGLALGINLVAPIAGSFIGLVLDGVLAPSVTFAVGLIALLVGITYGILPYGGPSMGGAAHGVIGAIAGGMVLSAIGMLLLVSLPVDFAYWTFGLVIS